MSYLWPYLPEIGLGCLIVGSLFPLTAHQRLWGVSFYWTNFLLWLTSQNLWDSLLSVNTPWEIWFRACILVLTGILLVSFYTIKPEQYILLMTISLSASMMVMTHHWLALFLWMEIQTLALFVLVSQKTTSVLSTEAGVKYFVLAAFASGLLLFGIALEYQTWGLLNFSCIPHYSTQLTFSQMLIVGALLFKLGAMPFHQWVPDVYEGSDWITLSILGSLPKMAILGVLVKLNLNTQLIWAIGLISILGGALGAFNQIKLRRLMAYSSISHSGFILLGLCLGSTQGYQLGSLYLIVYIFTFWLFSLIAYFFLSSRYSYPTWIGLKTKYPWAVLLLGTSLFSMAGIPPLGGFLVKWGILWGLVTEGYVYTASLSLLMACLGVGYYLWWVKSLYFEPQNQFSQWQTILRSQAIPAGPNYILGWGWFMVLSLLVFPSWLLDTLSWASWCIV